MTNETAEVMVQSAEMKATFRKTFADLIGGVAEEYAPTIDYVVVETK